MKADFGSVTETLHVDFDGYRLVYRVTGRGPALVVMNLYRRRADMVQAQALSDRYRVFQIFPLGHGYSDRAPGYTGEALPDQILTVLDRHDVNRFVVWGYSAGGAMSACITRSTPRAAGMVVGGYSPHSLTAGILRQLDRRLRPDHPSRSLWWWYQNFDWTKELNAMSCPRLFYWGGEDRQMGGPLRALRDSGTLQDVDFMEFPGFDHGGCNTPEALSSPVVPSVASWLGERLGGVW